MGTAAPKAADGGPALRPGAAGPRAGKPGYDVGYASDRVRAEFDKYLARLDRPTAADIRTAMANLARTPRPPGKRFKFLKPPIAVFQFTAQYRLRIGDHRILYDIDETARRVVLLSIRRRNERTYD